MRSRSNPLLALFVTGVVLVLSPARSGAASSERAAAANSARKAMLVDEGLKHLFAARLTKALDSFSKLTKLDPEDPQGWLLTAKVHWWRAYLTYPSREHDEVLKTSIEKVLSAAKAQRKCGNRNAQCLFVLGEAYSLRAQFKGGRGNFLGAARDAQRSRKMLKGCLQIEPDYADAMLGLGLYNYLVATMPRLAKVFRLVFFMPGGDRDTGLRQIKTAAEQGRIVRTEAAIFLSSIYLDQEETRDQGLVLLANLVREYPDNTILRLWRTLVLGKEQESIPGSLRDLAALKAEVSRREDDFSEELANIIPYHEARLHDDIGGHQTAVNVLVGLLERKPAKPVWIDMEARLLLASIYNRMGRRKEAEDLWDGISLADQEDRGKVKRRIQEERLVTIRGEDAARRLALDRGRYLTALGRCNEALEYFESLEDVEPSDPELLLCIGEIYLRNGKVALAREKFRASHEDGGSAAADRLPLRLAMVDDLEGRRDQALQRYKKLVENKSIPQAVKRQAQSGLQQPFSLESAPWEPCQEPPGP